MTDLQPGQWVLFSFNNLGPMYLGKVYKPSLGKGYYVDYLNCNYYIMASCVEPISDSEVLKYMVCNA